MVYPHVPTKTMAIIVLAILFAVSALLTYKHTHATPTPLPSSLDVTGTNLQLLGPIQVNGAFTVTFDFTPLNQNGSVTVLSSDKQMIDYKNDPSGNPGTLVLNETSYGPVYFQTYGATWHLTVN